MNVNVLLGLLVTMALPASAFASCDVLAGRWVNERGSAIMLENADASTGRINGAFVAEASIEGVAAYPLVGWTNKTAPTPARPHVVQSLSFTVRWGFTGSITAWSGYCLQNGDKTEIRTMWHLVRSTSENDFDHIHSGSDIFVQEKLKP